MRTASKPERRTRADGAHESSVSRVVINGIRPTTPDGVSDAKAVVGEPLVVSANVFADGHDELAARVAWRRRGTEAWNTAPMVLLGNDRWETSFVPTQLGSHEFVIRGWVDRWATWVHRVHAKRAAGQDLSVELEEGVLLLEDVRRRLDASDAFEGQLVALRRGSPTPADDVELARTIAAVPTSAVAVSASQGVWVDRKRAAVGSWYELFPRSYGGFAGTARRLPAVKDMGFDVVYFPPIHPIGTTARKGPGTTPGAGPDDPGSPWAIGSPAGGHTAVHPDLGSLEDFEELVRAAAGLGLEVALDLAYQCSPDHPWVAAHPEWFQHRPDGSIRYAENPPKKYEDIFPIEFLPADDTARQALWEACRDVVEFWIARGVRIFRVDNPHTKPFAFWRWMLADIRTRHADIVFLAEAFTRPRLMERLAEIGFSQGYTYFTWRTTRDELAAYGDELAHGPASDYFRPNLWPNTPDILSGPLRNGDLGAFKMRAALAATIGGSWGVYSGFELGENVPASESNEEYADSEKYRVADRDWDVPWSLAPYLRTLNGVRARHPAATDLQSLRFHGSTSGDLLTFTKAVAGEILLVVVNVDPQWSHEATLSLDLGALGLPWDASLVAYDFITDQTFRWSGPNPYVRLAPDEPAHVIDLRLAP